MEQQENRDLTPKQKLGEILIKRNVITQEQLDQALELQKKENRYIGEILVKLGFLEERDVVVALVLQCDLPYIAVNKYDIDKSVLGLIADEFARKHTIIPLDKVGKVLSVVMANPLDDALKFEIENKTQCRVAPFIATKSEIVEAIDRYYGKRP